MKNYKSKILMTFACLGLFALNMACEDNEPEVYNGNAFISFSEQNSPINVDENAGSREFIIGITETFDTDVTVTLSVTDDTAVENTDFVLSSNTVVIPAGEFVGSFSVLPTDDEEFNNTRSFDIEIVSVSDSRIKIGNANVDSYFKTINIVNDDCPSQTSLWFGNLRVQDPGYADIPATGSSTASGVCDVLLIDGDLSGYNAYSEPFELYFEPASEGATTGSVNLPPQVYCSACSEGFDAILSGSGTYNEDTQTIVLFWSLDRSDGASFGSGTHIITPL
ncbi:Calx-beta domain-containing protein [Winogradskyella sp. PC D3.3]